MSVRVLPLVLEDLNQRGKERPVLAVLPDLVQSLLAEFIPAGALKVLVPKALELALELEALALLRGVREHAGSSGLGARRLSHAGTSSSETASTSAGGAFAPRGLAFGAG